MTSKFAQALLPPFTLLDEPLLAFSSTDEAARHVNPLIGLATFGPFDARSFQAYVPQVRVATIGPASGRKSLGALLASLRDPHTPTDRKEYVPPFPGFERLFGVQMVAAESGAHIRCPRRHSLYRPRLRPSRRPQRSSFRDLLFPDF